MDSRPLPLPSTVVYASSELGGYSYHSLIVTFFLSSGTPGHAPQRPIQEPVAGLVSPTPLGSSSLGDRDRQNGEGGGRCGWGRRPYPDHIRRARPAVGVRWNRDAAPTWPCPPAWWVGRSLATRPRAVTPGERPEDPPARGDRDPARRGIRQGPQLYLLAEVRRPLSVHPADLRLALPSLPHLRAAVLQP